MSSDNIKVGDLVTCVKRNGWGLGAIYRVLVVDRWGTDLSCVYAGSFRGRRRKNRRADFRDCRPVTIEQMKESHRMLEALIAAEMNR